MVFSDFKYKQVKKKSASAVRLTFKRTFMNTYL